MTDENPNAPLAVALMGLPGCGKSTAARALMAERDLHEVNRDRIRAAMFPRCTFTEMEKRAAVAATFEAAATHCRLGRSCVVDGMPFSRRSEIDDLHGHVQGAGGRLLVLFLDCPVEEARRRVQADSDHPADDRDATLVDAVAERFQPPGPGAIYIDASRTPDQVARACVAAVAEHLPGQDGSPGEESRPRHGLRDAAR